VQQAAKPVTPSNIQRMAVRLGLERWATVRRDQTEAPVGSRIVVVIDEDLDRPLKVRRVQHQKPVQTFGPNRPHEPFGDPVRLRRVPAMPAMTRAAAASRVDARRHAFRKRRRSARAGRRAASRPCSIGYSRGATDPARVSTASSVDAGVRIRSATARSRVPSRCATSMDAGFVRSDDASVMPESYGPYKREWTPHPRARAAQ